MCGATSNVYGCSDDRSACSRFRRSCDGATASSSDAVVGHAGIDTCDACSMRESALDCCGGGGNGSDEVDASTRTAPLSARAVRSSASASSSSSSSSSGASLFILSSLCLLIGLLGHAPTAVAQNNNGNNNNNNNNSANLNTMEVLLKIYDETEGLEWTDHANWFTSSDVCTWKGISCYAATDPDGPGDERIGHVREIDLSENHVQGTLPEEVWDLPYLQVLNLRDNPSVDVTFRNVGNTQYLQNLILSNTAVTSLAGIAKVPSTFEEIHITDCDFGGPIPDEIYDVTTLRQLYFNYAGFTGTLSSKIGQLDQLTHLYLYENDLTGQIPDEIGTLSDLRVLALSQNAFGGTLPQTLNDLTKVEIMAIQRTHGKAKGEGITGPLPDLSNLRSVEEVYFENQRLTGTIPDNFLYYAPKQDGLKVNLQNNGLSGEVPATLKDFDRLNIYLVGNKFTSIASDLCTRSNWMDGDVGSSGGGCDAILCPIGTSSDLGRATAEDGPCVPCASSSSPYLGQTDCAGGADGITTDQAKILLEFYAATGGDSWNDRTGWASGDGNGCDWYGIDCDGDGNVVAINMKNNGLTGTPPSTIYRLPELTKLDLMANAIDFRFRGIFEATKLQYLWISNTGLSSTDDIDEIGQLPLKELRISQNKIGGPIPKTIFDISSLEYVSLSHNAFTGTLPTEIGQLTNLQEFHLYGGAITGQIPAEIGNIGGSLKRLALSENEFTGTLPAAALNKLTNLVELSIHQTSKSGSGIGGTLPSLSGMKMLTRLHLNSNSLKGPLPSDLLSGSSVTDEEVSIMLGDNQFTGTVPAAWSRFQKLILDLSGNMITGIGSGLCGMGDWNEKAVASYGCDAILCPVGEYNSNGRQAGGTSTCQSCPSAQYMGSVECGAIADDPTLNGDQKILEEIYYAAGGAQWKNSDGWTTDTDVCNWYGVSCNGSGSVTALDLSENNLEGSIPTSVFRLSALAELDLQSNDISFSFDEIDQAVSLTTLYLSLTGLESIDGIGRAKNLKVFHSTNNKLSTIPYDLYDVTSLEKVYLNYNNIGGRLSGSIKKLSNLEELYLMHNQLTGQIPSGIGGLGNIRVIGLTENNFDGTLPVELENLRTIEVLAIQREGGTDGQTAGGSDVGTNFGSNKNGKGISGPLLSFKDMPNLRELYLGSNSLTGTIPFDFLNGVEDKESRQLIVDLVSNQLEGRVPSSLSQFDEMSIYLADNKFEELADGLCNKDDWMKSKVVDFGCDAIMCPPNTYAKHGRQTSSDTVCTRCPVGSTAPFYGSFECINDLAVDSLKERDILTAIYNALRGPQWTLSTNWLNHDVSFCQWHGIECVSGTESVRGIRLPQNDLEGDVPSVIFELPNLEEINVAGNEIAFSFDGIEAASRLEYLNVDNIGLKSLSGLENAPQLKLLHVVGNNFGGTFPEEMYSLTNLEVLYLSDNDIGGRLHSAMAVLTNLVYLQCYECGLDQSIPTWLGSLDSLEYLRLDQNSLHGTIPAEIEGLTKIQHIDLSDQISRGGAGLTGPLPRFANLLDLTELYLFKNNLSGDIPSDFLFGEYKTHELQVDLRQNKLTGTISSSLAQLSKLSIYLAGNMMTAAIPAQICTMSFARGYGCDGVMCPPGTFNELGRQTSRDNPCQPCDDLDSTQYYGNVQCGMNNEKEILKIFYSELNGPDWDDNDNWEDAGASACKYHGITCTAGTDYVESIVLESNNLVGTVPTEIFNLPNLREIKLKSNDITFDFEGIESAQNLVRLHLSDTGLTSIDGIGMAQSLKYLHLTSNNLVNLPDDFFELSNLQDVYLNYNGIQGTLSTKIGKLTNLENLFVFHNRITGEIPTQVGYLTKLKTFAMAENYMSGTIPSELTSLSSLQIIALQREGGETAPGIGGPLEVKTAGEIGAGFTGSIPAFDQMPKLKELYLGANSLSGTIPRDFLSGIQDKSASIKVDLSQNNLVGTVPEKLTAFDSLKLYLSDNKLKALPDAFCSKSSWMGGEVATNKCDAIMCPPGTYNEYGRQANDETPCEPCPFTYTAEFYGSIECIPSNTGDYSEREILRLFFEATGGNQWSDKSNWLKDGVSVCQWNGITCAYEEGGAGDTVTRIQLPSNKLRGTVPPAIYQLPNLKTVDVSNNDVGFEFRGIEMARVLDALYLDRTRVSSLDGIGKASRLTTLHVQNNDFKGAPIPSELYDLGNLESLYLSDSNFGGTLSANIKKLDDLQEFYCHGNSLTGTLPPELGTLHNLKVLQLSENLFVGEIPREFDGMESLQSLFIDSYTRNSVGLSGPVPDFNQMEHLTEISLNANSLTGSIPDDFLINLKNKKSSVVIGLQDNQISGTPPQVLSRFSKLNIDVSGNMITKIDESLCALQGWQGGDVASFGCDAILCPAGTFNQYGRRSSNQFPCVPCEGAEQSPYMGSLICESDEKKKEKEILKLFYNVCGGKNWKNNDNWMSDDVDICHWFGISCKDGKTVDSILLGGNNVVGTPPAKIFEMTNLKWLWLYSNPINFKFDGIGNAKRLTSLLLDQTGLSSLRGIGAASTIEDLDLRFNNLKGPLPQEISQMINLKDFAVEGNQLTGALPSFDGMKRLERLRLGSNRFAGALQDFASNKRLKSIDVSGNIMSGPIPSTLLKGTDEDEEIYLDLSSNNFIDEVPGELARFEKMTIYLRDNLITGVNPALCENDAWNDGDVGEFNCDGILCPAGTFSENYGRQTTGGQLTQCVQCDKAKYFGASFCGVRSSAVSTSLSVAIGIVSASIAALAIPFI